MDADGEPFGVASSDGDATSASRDDSSPRAGSRSSTRSLPRRTPHVIVQAGDPLGIDGLVDRCGRSTAVVSGTVHLEIVRGVGDYVGRSIDDDCRVAGHSTVDLREYPRQEEAEDALAQGEVDAYSGNDFVTVDRPREFRKSHREASAATVWRWTPGPRPTNAEMAQLVAMLEDVWRGLGRR